MFSMKKPLRSAQRGQGMTEYIVIVALIAVAAIGVYIFFGQTVRQQTAGLALEVAGQSGALDVTHSDITATAANAEAQTKKGLASFDNNAAKQ